jgi:hypothetical protein
MTSLHMIDFPCIEATSRDRSADLQSNAIFPFCGGKECRGTETVDPLSSICRSINGAHSPAAALDAGYAQRPVSPQWPHVGLLDDLQGSAPSCRSRSRVQVNLEVSRFGPIWRQSFYHKVRLEKFFYSNRVGVPFSGIISHAGPISRADPPRQRCAGLPSANMRSLNRTESACCSLDMAFPWGY